MEIVTSDGLEVLTMHRVTKETGLAEGLIYHYFPTKGALIAAVQREALDVLGRAVSGCMESLERSLPRRRLSPSEESLARVVVATAFWVSAEEAYPEEMALCRRLFTDPAMEELDGADAEAAPALTLLGYATRLFDQAVEAGALQKGDSVERALLIFAGSAGVLLTSGIRRWDDATFDGRGLADALLRDLFVAWGADPDAMAKAHRLARDLAKRGELVPERRSG